MRAWYVLCPGRVDVPSDDKLVLIPDGFTYAYVFSMCLQFYY